MATLRYLISGIAFILLYCGTQAGNGEWLNLTNSNHITSVAHQGNEVWVGSRGGGLAKIDMATGNKTFYNKGNSGLPSNQVEAIQIDLQNNIWIGTYDQGLAKFDGQNWEVFNTENSDIPRNDIYDVKLDSDGNIWLGTLFSLVKYDGTNFTPYPIPGYTAATTLLVLAPDDIYTAWHITGMPSQVFHFDGTALDTAKGLDYDGLYKLHQDSQNRIWACYEGGVALKDGNNWVYFDSTNSAIANTQARTLAEWNGTLLLGTDAGVYAYNGTTWIESDVEKGNITHLQAINNTLYVGTLTDGLYKTDGGPLQRVQASNSNIPNNTFSWGVVRNDGQMVFNTTLGNGLVTFANNTWTSLPTTHGIGNYQQIALASDNSLWFCGYDSLFHYDGNTIQGWDIAANGMPGNGISTLAVDAAGKVYVGTYNNGFFTFDGTNWTLYNRSNSNISSDRIRCFAFVGNDVWIGTTVDVVQQVQYGGGIEVFNGSSFSRMHPDNSDLFTKYVTHLEVYGDSIWIGGDGGFGLYYQGTFTNYLYNNGSGSPLTFIKELAIDQAGAVYATGYNLASEGIMVKWDGTDFETFDATNTPLGDFAYPLYSMLFDSHGNLWFLHGTGIYVYKEGGVTNIEEELPSAIKPVATVSGVKVYPNPTKGSLNIELPQTHGHVTIFNLMGELVFETDIDQAKKFIDADNWSTGIYIYQINVGNSTHIGKLIVE